MTSVSTDRRQGVNSSAAVKVPVKAATTANITLSGEQTIDGVACVTDDRVLVKNQTTTANNGIYDVDTGSWTRAVDFDGTYDVKKGTLIYVNVFVWNDAGTLRATRGPLWDTGGGSNTVRGTGAGSTELELFQGRYVNKNAITNGPAARRGLYVGSIGSDAASQINDSLAKRHVWNMHSRVVRSMRNALETADTWVYSTATIRQANANAANQLDFLRGLDEDGVAARTVAVVRVDSAAGISVFTLIGLDSTTAMATGCYSGTATAYVANFQLHLSAQYSGMPGLGRRVLTWLEYSDAGANTTWAGDNGTPTRIQSGISGEMLA
jgi:hypothetical protein